MKIKKKVLIATIALICLLGITSVSLLRYYKNQPSYILNAYIKAINNRDYESAAVLFYEDDKLGEFKEDQLTTFLQKYFEEKGFVKMEEGRGQIGAKAVDEEKAFYEVRYTFASQNITSTLSIVKEDSRWQVVFPFRIEDVNIYTPLGSSVWFNNQVITDKEENKYTVKNVLPGSYVVRIAFPNEIRGDYVVNINVPTETEVIIPYETVEVNIASIEGTVVELGGEKQANKEGSVSFKNVLEGTYPLKIYDAYGNIETYEKSITVSNKKRQFTMDNFSLSDRGSKRLNKSINNFYQAYIEGIKKADSQFLKSYTTSDYRQKIVDEFEEWFVKEKVIKNAQIEIELEEIKLTKEGNVEVKVLEIVNLVNQELGEDNKTKNVDYQIVLKCIMTLKQDGENYQLQDRNLQESLVSYKDEQGKWIAY